MQYKPEASPLLSVRSILSTDPGQWNWDKQKSKNTKPLFLMHTGHVMNVPCPLYY